MPPNLGGFHTEFAFADFLTPLALRRAGGVFCVRILEAIASYWFESPQVDIQFLGDLLLFIQGKT